MQGETYIFYGKAEGNLLRKTMAYPIVEAEGRREFTGRIVPIYPLTAGVSQLILSRSIRQGLDACADILPDVLPDSVRREHHLCRIEYGRGFFKCEGYSHSTVAGGLEVMS